MILAYLDEAGDDGLPGSSPLFVMTTVYLDESNWRATLEEIRNFRASVKAWYGLPMKTEFHTKHFLLDKKPYRGMGISVKDRLDIVGAYCDLIASLDVRIVNVVIVKPNCGADYDVLDRAVNYLIQRVENDVTRSWQDGRFLIITDEGRLGKMRNTSRKMTKHNYIPSLYQPTAYRKLLRRMIEDPLPKNSKDSYFIQSADLVAEIVYDHMLLRLGIGPLHGRMPPEVDAALLTDWLDRLSPSLNLKAARGETHGIVWYPKPPPI